MPGNCYSKSQIPSNEKAAMQHVNEEKAKRLGQWFQNRTGPYASIDSIINGHPIWFGSLSKIT